jgi:Protein of unknown function (DUF1524)
MCGRDARTRVGDYVRLAWKIRNERLKAKEITRELKQIGEEFPIEGAVDALRKSKDCYTDWSEELRYFMFRYEEHLATELGQNFSNEQWERIWERSAADSIEHIWPQSKAPESQMHRLGNLVLLPPPEFQAASRGTVQISRPCGLSSPLLVCRLRQSRCSCRHLPPASAIRRLLPSSLASAFGFLLFNRLYNALPPGSLQNKSGFIGRTYLPLCHPRYTP